MATFNDRKNVDNNWVGTKREDDMRGAGGNDIMSGAGGNDWLWGGAGNDTLNGGEGNDYIRGDGGIDSLTGGSGADRFEWVSLTDSNATDGIDTVTDFNSSQGDILELRNLTGSTTLDFVDTPTGTANEFTLTYDGQGTTVLNLYLPGDTVADATVYLQGAHMTSDGIMGA